MTYRTRTLLTAVIGLAVMAGLGLFAYYGLHTEHQTEQREQAFARLALDVDTSRVVRLELEREGGSVVLERAGKDGDQLATWRLRAPVEAEADDLAVNALLGVLERMDAERRVPLSEVAGLAEFGLAPPALTWTLVLDGGQRVGLQVGRKSPFSEQLYLRKVGADEIMLVQGHLADSLTKEAFDLRRKELLRVEPDLVQALVLQTPPRPAGSGKPPVRMALERREGDWHLTAPIADRADPDEVRKLLNTTRNLRAQAFPEGDLPAAQYGLEPPGWVVTLTSGPDRVETKLHVGRGQLPSNEQKLFARAVQPPGPVARIPAYVLPILDKTPFQLQAKAPVVFDTTRAARIKLSREAELIVLERARAATDGGQAEDWSLVSPVAGPAKAYRVKALLSALARLKAIRFEGPAEPAVLSRTGLDRPRWTVVVDDDSGQGLARLQIGKAAAEGTYVLGDARESVCLVPTAALASVTASLADLRAGPGTAVKKP